MQLAALVPRHEANTYFETSVYDTKDCVCYILLSRFKYHCILKPPRLANCFSSENNACRSANIQV